MGNVVNAGRIDVGGTGGAGALYIFGNYTQTAAGRLNLEIGGSGPGTQYDYLYVDGTAALDGQLDVALIGGFAATEGEAFRILDFAARGGDFGAMTGLDLGGGLRLNPLYDDFGLTLEVIPA